MKQIEKRRRLRIAKERIDILLKLAEKYVKSDLELSRRYVKLAKKIALRANFRLGKLKRKFCKNCYTYFIPGYNCIVRLNSRERCVRIICLNCKKIYRHGY